MVIFMARFRGRNIFLALADHVRATVYLYHNSIGLKHLDCPKN